MENTDPHAALVMLQKNQISPMVGHLSSFPTDTATYFTRFPRDRIAYKLLVAYFVINNTLDTAFDCHWCYQTAVNGGTVVLVCQLFFVWRTFQISGKTSYIITGIQTTLIVGGAVCIYWIGVFATSQTSLQAFNTMGPVMDGWVAACLAADVLITATLVYYIYYKPRKLVGDAVRSSPLMRLVVLACETNLMSLIVQAVLVGLSVYSVRNGSLHYLIMAFLEPKAYMACVIITLKARREGGNTDIPSTTSDTSRSKGFGSRFNLGSLNTHPMSRTGDGAIRSVQVHVEHNSVIGDKVSPEEYALQNQMPYKVQFIEDEGADLEKRAGTY
ncbi:hypothetical protein JCM11641_007553 [Rhodosporidiobolus odoratus]